MAKNKVAPFFRTRCISFSGLKSFPVIVKQLMDIFVVILSLAYADLWAECRQLPASMSAISPPEATSQLRTRRDSRLLHR